MKLKIAGPQEQTTPGIYKQAKAFLRSLLQKIKSWTITILKWKELKRRRSKLYEWWKSDYHHLIFFSSQRKYMSF